MLQLRILVNSFDSESILSLLLSSSGSFLACIDRDAMNIVRGGAGGADAGWLLLMVEAAGAGGRGRGVARGLVLVLLQPLRTGSAKLLTQLK